MRFWRRIPYVLEVGDLWPDAPIELGFVQSSLLKKFLFRIERAAYKNARAIVALSPEIQQVVQSRAPGKQVHMIPNMADCDFFRPEEKRKSVEQKLGVENKFVISYLGAFGFANGLDYLLECAVLAARARLPVQFLLAGDGALKEDLARKAGELGLSNVTFLPYTNRDGVKEIMNVTDAMFVCYRNSPILATGSPNKFFDGLASGKLIIINFGGWIRKEVTTSGCGIALDGNAPSLFPTMIQPVVENRDQHSAAARAARQLAERNYSRSLLCKEWIVYLEQAFGQG
jgi:glycosyltransferase involved in cell wall biosynthesis